MTDEIINHNRKIFTDEYGPDEPEYIDDKMKEVKNRKIIYYGSIEYGAEESVEAAIKGVLNGLGIDSKKIEMKLGD